MRHVLENPELSQVVPNGTVRTTVGLFLSLSWSRQAEHRCRTEREHGPLSFPIQRLRLPFPLGDPVRRRLNPRRPRRLGLVCRLYSHLSDSFDNYCQRRLILIESGRMLGHSQERRVGG